MEPQKSVVSKGVFLVYVGFRGCTLTMIFLMYLLRKKHSCCHPGSSSFIFKERWRYPVSMVTCQIPTSKVISSVSATYLHRASPGQTCSSPVNLRICYWNPGVTIVSRIQEESIWWTSHLNSHEKPCSFKGQKFEWLPCGRSHLILGTWCWEAGWRKEDDLLGETISKFATWNDGPHSPKGKAMESSNHQFSGANLLC